MPEGLFVNNGARDLPRDRTVRGLLSELGLPVEGLLVVVNGQAVPTGEWADFGLSDGDRVELIQAVAGG